ncbi:MAG: Lpg1974 family pore-forming outer membrane protein, partial [Planctomycetota bacterium]
SQRLFDEAPAPSVMAPTPTFPDATQLMSDSGDMKPLRLLLTTLFATALLGFNAGRAFAQMPGGVPESHPLSWIGPDGTIHLDRMPTSGPIAPSMSPTMVGAPFAPSPAMCPPPCPQPMVECCICDPCMMPPHRHRLFAEILYLHPSGADVAHAQQQNGVGGAGTVPFGTIGVTDPDFKPGYRVGGGFALSDLSSFELTYSYYANRSRSSLNAPVIPGGGGSVGSLVLHPGASITSSAGPVDANYDLDFQMADFDIRRALAGDCRYWVNFTSGLRVARLQQDFRQTGVFSGTSGGVIDTQTQIDFDGFGPKFAIDGERVIGCRGLSIYARASVSPLFGEFENRYTMTNDSVDVLLAQANWTDDRVVTVLDYELGLAWIGPRRKWRLSTGYVVTHWYNVMTTSMMIDSVQADNYGHDGETLTFGGFTARVERRF